ncbi:hypothetical protein [Vibrio phage 4141]|uniref:Uncharacterized protein n=2 Tax=Chatterjeevirus TaxID=2732679 RepID=D0Q193_9CAUD|nr:hypothetical protein VN4_09 [Vibrio phage N4]ACR16474.1 hypothetical protein VN4_09 [Vibrio phage N4]
MKSFHNPKPLRQRKRLLNRKGKTILLTEQAEGLLMRLENKKLGLSSDKWLFTVQDGNVLINFADGHWCSSYHNHWLDSVKPSRMVIVDTHFKC